MKGNSHLDLQRMILELRKVGLTQKEIASKLEVNQSTICRILSEKRVPNYKIANGVEELYFFHCLKNKSSKKLCK